MRQDIQIISDPTDAQLRETALSRSEFQLIKDLLGRAPNHVELGIFGAMWSEHCGYKNSKPLLKRLPSTGARILFGPGSENAGAIDAGNDLAVVFKIESHNHPSAVEPFEGAATGVGGILRDIFTMGARPIALLDSLRFGSLDVNRTRYLFHGVVGGIGHYGNCIGVPTVGGEVSFDDTYTANILVNAMCIGVAPKDKMISAKASGIGNPLLLVGADTGRDGIHGATFASVTDPGSTQRSAVQVGNPFLEKLLLEACLELRDTGWLVGLQDLGAAGLTSSSVETAHKGGCGVEIDVAKAPRRESGMSAYEVMLSESQERMLAIVDKEHIADVQGIFAKWGLHSDCIGYVIEEPALRIKDGDTVLAEIPTDYLTEKTPMYTREGLQDPAIAQLWQFDFSAVPAPESLSAELLAMLAHPDIASKKSVYQTYDHLVGNNTVIAPGSDAAVLRMRDEQGAPTGVSLAVSTDCVSRMVYLDPFNGGAMAVAESARNCVCAGATPVALTNCLNFGNPEKPEVYYQLASAIDGMAAAAKALQTPVVSGNVSLYNESQGSAIYPTPVIGMVGLLEHNLRPLPSSNLQTGDGIYLMGPWYDQIASLAGSLYMAAQKQIVAGRPVQIDLALEARLQKFITEAHAAALLQCAHDCSDGGLACALAEMAIWSDIGVTQEKSIQVDSPISALFGEAPSRILVGISPEKQAEALRMAAAYDIPFVKLGTAGGAAFQFLGVELPVAEMKLRWENGLVEAVKE